MYRKRQSFIEDLSSTIPKAKLSLDTGKASKRQAKRNHKEGQVVDRFLSG